MYPGHTNTNTLSHANSNSNSNLPNTPMLTPREEFGLVTLPDGKLFAIGGADVNVRDNDVLNSTEIFDFATNSWTAGPSMLQERQLGGVAVVGGKVYYVGGENSTQDVSDTIEIFDIATNKWSLGPKLKWTRESFGVGVIGKKMYFIGGQVDDGNAITLKNMLILDTETHTVSRGADMHQRRSDMGVAVLDGKMYAMGGFSLEVNYPTGGFIDTMEVYDPATKKWTLINATMSKKRGALTAAVVDGKIVAAGGFWDGIRPHPDPHPTDGGVLALVEMWDPKSPSAWTLGAPLSGKRTSMSSTVAGGTMWVAGGENNDDTTLDTLEAVKLK